MSEGYTFVAKEVAGGVREVAGVALKSFSRCHLICYRDAGS